MAPLVNITLPTTTCELFNALLFLVIASCSSYAADVELLWLSRRVRRLKAVSRDIEKQSAVKEAWMYAKMSNSLVDQAQISLVFGRA